MIYLSLKAVYDHLEMGGLDVGLGAPVDVAPEHLLRLRRRRAERSVLRQYLPHHWQTPASRYPTTFEKLPALSLLVMLVQLFFQVTVEVDAFYAFAPLLLKVVKTFKVVSAVSYFARRLWPLPP